MKNKISVQIFLLIVAVVVGVLFLKGKKSSTPVSPYNEISFKESNSGKTSEADQIVVGGAQNPAAKEIKVVDISRCAPFVKATDYSEIVREIKLNTQIQTTLEMNEFQLTGQKREEIVVQEIPDELPKDQVRVFVIASDGLPDRVKDFPNATGSLEQKLEGALTLGSLNKKIEKFQGLSRNGEQLLYEVEKEKVVRISFVKGKSQLLCEDGNCSCNQF